MDRALLIALARTLALAALLAPTLSCAVYHPVSTNFRHLRETGLNGVRITFAPAAEQKELGRIRATARSWLFADCDAVGQRALERLATQASARGANLVSELRFRGKWRWLQEPVCRRNFTWGLLVLPLALPIPVSVSVTGYADATPEQQAFQLP